MRWIDPEVFVAGEPNPYPPEVPALYRRMRAIPLDAHPARTWLLSQNGLRTWHRLHDRYADSVVGYAWVRRTALRRHRAAWALWVLAAVVAVVSVLVWGPTHESLVRDFSGFLGVLLLAAVLLINKRVRAVIDPDDGEIGIRG